MRMHQQRLARHTMKERWSLLQEMHADWPDDDDDDDVVMMMMITQKACSQMMQNGFDRAEAASESRNLTSFVPNALANIQPPASEWLSHLLELLIATHHLNKLIVLVPKQRLHDLLVHLLIIHTEHLCRTDRSTQLGLFFKMTAN